MKSLFSFTRFATFVSLLAVTQAASNSTNGTSCGVAKVDDSYLSVVGVQGTGVHPRQELRELEKDTELWNIFLQAFSRFQAMDQSEKVSYYQVASIHGAPFKEWDGVTGQADQEMMGYCPHTSSMFGPWHRPYLALFEQILHDRSLEIANEHPAGQARIKAVELANRIRLPEFQFKNWNHTIRYPLNGFAVNATSRDDEVNVRVGKQQPNLRSTLYKLLTTYQPFMQVSNKANGGTIGNFETLHDGVHNTFGLGHLGIVEVSAFDPAFWFHHCNMDRIIAMYQSRYPDTWIEDSEQAMGTFAVSKGSVLGTASSLAPFHRNALGDMWTSTTARDWTAFGYTYPELVGNPSNESLTLSINHLYKPQTQCLNNTNTTIPAPGRNTTNTTQVTEWLCEVNMPTDIKISYSVRAFFGKPNANPKKWPTDPNHVGQLASMSSPRMNSSVIVTGTIDLTEKLAQRHQSGELKALDKESVTAYLKANLTWRIQALDYSEIPRKNAPAGLNLTVFNVPVTVPQKDTDVPIRSGDIEYVHGIEGNPPIYSVPGSDGTNSTLPVNQVGGTYNATSGNYEWKNAADRMMGEEGAERCERKTKTQTVTSLVTEYVTLVSSPSSTLKSLSSVATVTEQTPTPTISAGPRTKYVTSVIIEYVTV
ncbi:tyrosinase [Cucurbitaria berberidis CBS 394.84]|uniref:tyrosinase n=1 Tax=Cucurbitaria berberidis CBS 394.84 TaxID=1168544 RepID=A0A9P4GH35_9PLEO|nr:tyrosinase [Cucurbitaria berberidis CBS 394.84]KAF1845111.1 tyrosinase [Cucurbitaria berberidis CBS 394.84]